MYKWLMISVNYKVELLEYLWRIKRLTTKSEIRHTPKE